MKIVIFGATGKVGRNVTEQALADGYEVTAFVRQPTEALGQHPKLKFHMGDVLNAAAVADAIAGQDAVLVALGAPIGNKDGIREKGTANVIKAMQLHGPKRLVCLSGHGAGESHSDLPRLYRWVIMPLILKHVYADHEKQEALVKSSGLDWTLVRPTNYIDGPKTSDYRVNFGKKASDMKFKITFADVAQFMIRQLSDQRFKRQAASISN